MGHIEEDQQPEPEGVTLLSRRGWLAVAGIAITLVAVIAGWIWIANGPQREARDLCVQRATDYLNAVSAAPVQVDYVNRDGDTFTIHGSVDTDSKHAFQCTVIGGQITDWYVL